MPFLIELSACFFVSMRKKTVMLMPVFKITAKKELIYISPLAGPAFPAQFAPTTDRHSCHHSLQPYPVAAIWPDASSLLLRRHQTASGRLSERCSETPF